MERYSAEWWREYRLKRGESLRIYKREYDSKQYKLHPEREYKRRRRWVTASKLRSSAHSAVHYAIKIGKLIPQSCMDCGAPALAHHPDYSKPLEVEWVCQLHHKQRNHVIIEVD